MTTLFSTFDVARLVGIPEHRLVYAHRHRSLPEPSYFVGNRRIYTPDDLRRVADYFNVPVPLIEQEMEHEKGEEK